MISKRFIQVTLIILEFSSAEMIAAGIFLRNSPQATVFHAKKISFFEYFKSMAMGNGYKYFTHNEI